ncbi:MAG: hypothetical protein ABSA12_06320 [Verrucomicrobiia bacterium]|jgi:fibronectin-binding autotransporter adhesin
MKRRVCIGARVPFFLAVIFFSAPLARAQFTASIKTNTVNGVHSNWVGNGSYIVGSNTFQDVLQIINGGVLSNGTGYIGYEVSGSNNLAVVTGPGSVWSNRFNLYVGYNGAGNSLLISNGGAVLASNTFISNAGSLTGCGTISGTVVVGTNSTVLANCGGTLTFTGSVTNNGTMQAINGTTLEAYGTVVNNGTIDFYRGATNFHGAFINNGTVVAAVTIGNGPTSPDGSYRNADDIAQTLSFTNVGITSTNGGTYSINIGDNINLANSLELGPAYFDLLLTARTINLTNNILFGSGALILDAQTVNLNATVTTTNGALLSAPYGIFGTATQVNVLSDTDSLQQAIDLASPTNLVTIQVSPGQYPGDLTISNTQVTLVSTNGETVITASNLIIGVDSFVATNRLTIDGGSLYVTNALATGALDVRNGTLTFRGVMATVDNLLLTNGTLGTMIFSNGTLQVGSTAVTNGQQFVVGDGADSATYHLLGGVHSFNNGLRIRNNATLSGCGSISGVVLVDAGGSVVADCGGTLTFNGSVTNNGIMHAENGSILESYGPVVNNGIIDIMDGSTNFHSTVVDHGTIVEASYFQVVSLAQQSNDMNIVWTTVGGRSNVVQFSTGDASGNYSNNFTDLSTAVAIPGTTLGTTNFLDVGGATNTPSRYYRVRLVP